MIDLKRIKTLFIDGQEVKSLSINNQIVWKKSSGWKGLKIENVGNGTSSIFMYKGNATAPEITLMYSLDDGQTWNDFTVCSSSSSLDGTIITLPSGFGLCFKAGEGGNNVLATATSAYNNFMMSGSSVKASGNINSLLDGEGFEEIDDLTGRNFCFVRLFNNCNSLVDASKLQLPATTLADRCYYYMFYNCKSLTQAPELPATTLANNCYYGMFRYCSSLTEAPELPATTLANTCYYYMFTDCTSLTQAPELPATTLVSSCYAYMFQNCKSLTQAPELPATTLANYCYQYMFYGCSSLNKIKLGYTGDYDGYYFSNWVYGVAPNGDLETNTDVLKLPQGVNGIPFTWTWNGQEMPEYDGLKFKAEEANSTIKMVKSSSSAPSVTLQYSTNGGMSWSSFYVYTSTTATNGTTITLANVGDEVLIKASSTNTALGKPSYYNYFVMTGKVAASGNINSLLDGNNWNSVLTIPSDYCFRQLFYGCTSLTTAPELPATTLKNGCYSYMFYNCSSLRSAPQILPATTLTSHCYDMMFLGCKSLEKSPDICATTIDDWSGACQSMFQSCSVLNSIMLRYTGGFSGDKFSTWVRGVPSTGTFFYNGSVTSRGESAIPTGWTIQTF